MDNRERALVEFGLADPETMYQEPISLRSFRHLVPREDERRMDSRDWGTTRKIDETRRALVEQILKNQEMKNALRERVVVVKQRTEHEIKLSRYMRHCAKHLTIWCYLRECFQRGYRVRVNSFMTFCMLNE